MAPAPSSLYKLVALPEIVSTMYWAELLKDPPADVALSLKTRNTEPFLAQVKTDAELLMNLKEGVTEVHETAPVFPWMFGPSKRGQTFRGVATNNREVALRLVLVQTGIATYNSCKAVASNTVEFKARLTNAYMMAVLANKITAPSTTPEYNPGAVRMGYDTLIALLVEMKVYEHKYPSESPSDLKKYHRTIGTLLQKARRGELTSAWASWVKGVETWHREELSMLVATELWDSTQQDTAETDMAATAIKYVEIESLLKESNQTSTSLYTEVTSLLDNIGWRRSAPRDYQLKTWSSIVTGAIYDTIPKTTSWCEKCERLSSMTLIAKLFPSVEGYYMKDASMAAEVPPTNGGSNSNGSSSSLSGPAAPITDLGTTGSESDDGGSPPPALSAGGLDALM